MHFCKSIFLEKKSINSKTMILSGSSLIVSKSEIKNLFIFDDFKIISLNQECPTKIPMQAVLNGLGAAIGLKNIKSS